MNPLTIREFAASFQKSRILLSGFELDIFTHINKEGTLSQQVAKKLNLDEHACDRLMNALAALGFLVKKDGLFYNTEDGFRFLSKKSANYIGGLMHTNHLWNTWSHLTEVVKTGKPAHPEKVNESGDGWTFAFIHAMHDRAKKQAPQQISDIDLSGVKKLLDVGGGSGAYSMQFVARKPEIEATVFDLENVIPITEQFIEKEGFKGRIKTCTGDYKTDQLPGGFDLVFLSAIIHSNPFETNQKLIKKCYKSLNRGGRIILMDWIMNNERTEPVTGAVFAINMLVGTDGGDCFTEKEVSEMLGVAGFKNISKLDLEAGLSQMMAERV
ncbi:MAG: methyltransferase domain-containing protein [Bacteroidales bacterium]|nr:methyltransferase domain-containing protein [Bacteroidales bacterium]